MFLEEYRPHLDAECEARPGGERQGDDEDAAGQHQRGADTSAPGGVTQRLAAARPPIRGELGPAASQSQLTCSSRTCRWCRARSCGSRTPRSPPSWSSSRAPSPCHLHNIGIVRRSRQCRESIIFIKFKLQMPEACHEVC